MRMYVFSLLALTALVACSVDERHKPINEYLTTGDYSINTRPARFSEPNKPDYSFSLRPTAVDGKQALTFVISIYSDYRDPKLTLFLDQAQLVLGNQVVKSLQTEAVVVSCKSPLNTGDGCIADYEISFPPQANLHWGERITSKELAKELKNIAGFKVIMPAELPMVMNRMMIGVNMTYILSFDYQRSERAGDPLIKNWAI